MLYYAGKAADGMEFVVRAVADYCVLRLDGSGISEKYRGRDVAFIFDGRDFWDADSVQRLYDKDAKCARQRYKQLLMMRRKAVAGVIRPFPAVPAQSCP